MYRLHHGPEREERRLGSRCRSDGDRSPVEGDGTYRPVGLIPWMPKTWMRARKIYATAWERITDASWIYAGVGKGADIAAWKQAATAELTDLAEWKTGYAQALLDLAKAFDRVPYWLLLQEAPRARLPAMDAQAVHRHLPIAEGDQGREVL